MNTPTQSRKGLGHFSFHIKQTNHGLYALSGGRKGADTGRSRGCQGSPECQTPFIDVHSQPPLLVGVLRRRFTQPLDHAGVGDGRNGSLDPINLNLMIPIVPEVEPVSEDSFRFQIQIV